MVNREEVEVEGFPYKVGVPSGCTKWVYVYFVTLSKSYVDQIAGHRLDKDEVGVIEKYMHPPTIISKM
jgi:hypothetical protein